MYNIIYILSLLPTDLNMGTTILDLTGIMAATGIAYQYAIIVGHINIHILSSYLVLGPDFLNIHVWV